MTAGEYQQMIEHQFQAHQRFAAQQQLQAQQQAHEQALQQQQRTIQTSQLRAGTPNGLRQYHPTAPSASQNGDGPSPSEQSSSLKRTAIESPLDGTSKKARLAGKKPSKLVRLSSVLIANHNSAPEEHQRQAMEIASRATRPDLPTPSGLSQMPGHPQNRGLNNIPQVGTPTQGQVRSAEDTYIWSQGNGMRVISDAEKQYALNQINYVKQQVANSPANLTAMSPAQITSPLTLHNPAQSPVVYDSLETGQQNAKSGLGKGRGKNGRNLSLTLDTDLNGDGFDSAQLSGASTNQKRKMSGKKPIGRPPGVKGKPGKVGHLWDDRTHRLIMNRV